MPLTVSFAILKFLTPSSCRRHKKNQTHDYKPQSFEQKDPTEQKDDLLMQSLFISPTLGTNSPQCHPNLIIQISFRRSAGFATPPGTQEYEHAYSGQKDPNILLLWKTETIMRPQNDKASYDFFTTASWVLRTAAPWCPSPKISALSAGSPQYYSTKNPAIVRTGQESPYRRRIQPRGRLS